MHRNYGNLKIYSRLFPQIFQCEPHPKISPVHTTCEQQMCRSDCASAQSDQRTLCSPQIYILSPIFRDCLALLKPANPEITDCQVFSDAVRIFVSFYTC